MHLFIKIGLIKYKESDIEIKLSISIRFLQRIEKFVTISTLTNLYENKFPSKRRLETLKFFLPSNVGESLVPFNNLTKKETE